MTEQTPAPSYADLLAALAGHLRAHPDLAVFDASPTAGLYVHTQGVATAAGTLAAWFASIGATDLRVRLQIAEGYAEVHTYTAVIGGHRVPDVWGTVDGLERHLVQGGIGRWREGLRIALAELEHFAGHGTLPEAVS
jgi:hypothetical protein